jgi:hypothetical protein
MLMPLATSLVKYRLAGKRGRLATLVLVGAVSVAIAIFAIERRRDPVVSWAARERVVLRTKANKPRARAAQVAAAKAAWSVVPKHHDDIERDGKLVGDAIDHAREALKKFYKTDEAQAFDGWVSHGAKGSAGMLVLYVEASGNKPAIFVATDRTGHEVRNVKELPKGALAAMRLAADGIALEL